MKKNVREIYRMFGGRLVGRTMMKRYVCETLVLFPAEIIEFVATNCWFFGSLDDAWAFTFTGNDLKDQHMIFISDELMAQSPVDIYYTIAHEVGHVMLGHRNSTLVKQSRQEIQKQEGEADTFARKYLG